jgi:peptidoglycan/LPS O-acetylase OafA/YrhL
VRPASGRERIPSLDGLRGLAAIVVAIRHTMNAIAIPDAVQRGLLQSPLAVLLNAEGAVQLFFVLSGWVLAASLERGRRTLDVAQFYVRRVFRIHPPYVVAVLVAWGLSFLYAAEPGGVAVHGWQRLLTGVHITPHELLASLAFPGDAFLQLPVGWTLRIEAIYSILLPLLFVLARPVGGMPLLAVAALALAVPGTPRWLDHALDFSLGVVTFHQRERLRRWLGAMRGGTAVAFVAGAAALHAGPLLLGWLIHFDGPWVVEPRRGASLAMASVGACGLVVAALFLSGPQRVFAWTPFAAAGRVSYSLYLFHLPIIQLLLWLWAPAARLSTPQALLLVALVVATSWAVAEVAWAAVERPSIRMGNRVSRRLARVVEPESVPAPRPTRSAAGKR